MDKNTKAIFVKDKVFLIDDKGNVSIIMKQDYLKDKVPVDNKFLKAIEYELKLRKKEEDKNSDK